MVSVMNLSTRKLVKRIGLLFVWCSCLVLTFLAFFGLAGQFTSLSGLIHAKLWIPVTICLLALVVSMLLRRAIGIRRGISSGLAIVNFVLLVAILGKAKLVPWTTEEVVIDANTHRLAGTLYVPRSPEPHPAVVLIHGSTRQTRDSLGGLYRSNAELFAKNGYAALVYDKRGCGKSGGDFENALMPEFAEDAMAAIEHLAAREDIDQSQIGVWGISAGGWVAPLVAKDSNKVKFVILASTPVVPESEQRLFEWAQAIRKDRVSDDYVANALRIRRKVWRYYSTGEKWEQLSTDLAKAKQEPWWSSIRAVFPDGIAKPETVTSEEANSEFRWHRTDCFRDPAPILASLHQPIMAFYGTNDSVIDTEKNSKLMWEIQGRRQNPLDRFMKIRGANHALLGSLLPPQIDQEYKAAIKEWLKKIEQQGPEQVASSKYVERTD